MPQAPFTPSHKARQDFELRWHRTCCHYTWVPRERFGAGGESLASDDQPNPRHVRMGTSLCPDCGQAEAHPGAGVARLLASPFLKRIVAIGFGRPRGEELMALRFNWRRSEQVWVFEPVTGSLDTALQTLATTLECKVESVDTRILPPLPGPPAEPKTAKEAKQPIAAILICGFPNSARLKMTDDERESYPIVATLPFPPSLNDLPDGWDQRLDSDTPRFLIMPEVPELISLGLTLQELWSLAQAAALKNIVIRSNDNVLAMSAGPESTKGPRALFSLPGPFTPPPEPSPPKSKGGRPPKARSRGQEVIDLAKQEGATAAGIALKIGISLRSVRRILKANAEPVSTPSSLEPEPEPA